MKILITAGPTHEHIDPIRYIANNSSGLQGILIAKSAARFIKNSQVILIIGPTHIEIPKYKNLKVINVTSADEMFEAVNRNFNDCDVSIFSAAVADYKPATFSNEKIKSTPDNINIDFIPNKDIAFEMGKIKNINQKTIGFALETNNGIENALSKIKNKNLDFIILNEISIDNPAFGSKFNKVTIIGKDGHQKFINKTTKEQIANKILDLIYEAEMEII